MKGRDIAGLILAGGRGSRIGGDKALLPFCGGTLLDAVLARVEPQVSTLALSVPAAQAYRSRYPQFPLLVDSFPQRIGPLAGVIAGLEWARKLVEVTWLAAFPCDTPFLPHDLVAQLMTAARQAPVFAHNGERLHGVCAVWPVACLEALRTGVEDGSLRSLYSAMRALGGSACRIEAGDNAFFNINTREDLLRAEDLARSAE